MKFGSFEWKKYEMYRRQNGGTFQSSQAKTPSGSFTKLSNASLQTEKKHFKYITANYKENSRLEKHKLSQGKTQKIYHKLVNQH